MQRTAQLATITTVTFLCLLIFCACPKRTLPNSGPVVYPQGWPIPQLTVPPGAVSTTVHHTSLGDGENGVYQVNNGRDVMFSVGFRSLDEWTIIQQHVSGCLFPLGYSGYREEENANISQHLHGVHVSEYVSSDNLTTVQLYFASEDDAYHLMIVRWAEPVVSR